jgi:regulator of nucleoside diphosphate kinase
MTQRSIIVTAADRRRLGTMLDQQRELGLERRRLLDDLEHEIERAEVVEPWEVPNNVITMNSTVKLRDLDSGEEFEWTLVYPAGTNANEGRVSVLAPVGTALIGYREGDVVEWPVPGGQIRLQVEEVLYQPERAGAFDR